MNIKCFFGFHEPEKEWILKWSSKVYYCKCTGCGKFLIHGQKGSYTESEFYRKW
jgi:hypothetical protein